MKSYRLFIYDHCPYCVKARMIFGLKNIPLENITLLNDDEKTPISMIGKKMLPILEKEDQQFMPESIDIIQYIDQKFSPSIISMEEDSFLMSKLNQARSSYYSLTMPRWVKSDMEEFKTPASRDYFQKKKELMIGSFDSAFDQTDYFKKDISQILKDLSLKISPSLKQYKEGQWSLNDFHLFAFLRGLSIVKGLEFPKNVQTYMENVSQSSGVPLSTHLSL